MDCRQDMVDMKNVRLLRAGEQGLVVEFGQGIDPVVNARVHAAARLIAAAHISGVMEVVPTYRSLLVYFDPLIISRKLLSGRILPLLPDEKSVEAGEEARIVEIPCCYGGEFGPDMERVTSHTGLSVEEVVELHSLKPYMVYMLGFTPGLAYLGGLPQRLATPRREKPRVAVPEGSVAIAGTQTTFYPAQIPGGWQIIGRTPLKGFDPLAENPFLLNAGDYVLFKPVTIHEYTVIKVEVDARRYRPAVSKLSRKDGARS